jgi:hypothetical protein
MMLVYLAPILLMLVTSYGFTPAVTPNIYSPLTSSRNRLFFGLKKSILKMMDSDFATAMPSKPELSPYEKLVERGREYADRIRSYLGEGVEEPKELTVLEDACQNKADSETLAIRIYELMIEEGMLYDKNPETAMLTPTSYDIPSNLDVPEVKSEFKYLYSYGMSLIVNGMITMENVKGIVQTRLISRTGLEPEEFDAWLGF